MICQNDFEEKVDTPKKRKLVLKFLCSLIKNYTIHSTCFDIENRAGINQKDLRCKEHCPLDLYCMKYPKDVLAREVLNENYTEEEIFEEML